MEKRQFKNPKLIKLSTMALPKAMGADCNPLGNSASDYCASGITASGNCSSTGDTAVGWCGYNGNTASSCNMAGVYV
jgi:hypothetical protein